MSLPEQFVKDNLEKSRGMKIFDTPIEDLTRDELMACVFHGYHLERKALKEAQEEREFLESFR